MLCFVLQRSLLMENLIISVSTTHRLSRIPFSPYIIYIYSAYTSYSVITISSLTDRIIISNILFSCDRVTRVDTRDLCPSAEPFLFFMFFFFFVFPSVCKIIRFRVLFRRDTVLGNVRYALGTYIYIYEYTYITNEFAYPKKRIFFQMSRTVFFFSIPSGPMRVTGL